MVGTWLDRVIGPLTQAPPWLTRTLVAVLVAAPLVAWGGASLLASDDAPLVPATDPVTADQLYVDTDRDALPDLLENYVYGSDANASHTASRVVPDGYLARYGFDPTDPTAEERWAAYPGPGQAPAAFGPGGLPIEHRATVRDVYLYDMPADWNSNETGPWDNGLDPTEWRTPSGIALSWLLGFGLDPLDPAVGDEVLLALPDGDGLTVRQSYETATDPRVADTDGDGLADHQELAEHGTDPARFDTLGGGVADGWAIRYGLDPASATMAGEDPDRDGLSNAAEFAYSVGRYGLEATLAGDGLDPTRRSSGGAPVPDGWLVRQGLDPFAAGVTDRRMHCASEYGPVRDLDELDDLCLTVLDAYVHQRPAGWDEAVSGPWFGGLTARGNDTDGDGLPDAVELRGWLTNITTDPALDARGRDVHVTSDPLTRDTDHDGLSDAEEYLGRTRSRTSPDGSPLEAITFTPTDPSNADTDFDGLSDGTEILFAARTLAQRTGGGTLDPVSRDTDRDGLEDGREWDTLRARAQACRDGAAGYGFTNPEQDVPTVLAQVLSSLGTSAPADQGVCDTLEPWGDPDGDALANILDDDSDDDGLLDGWEVDPRLYNQSPFASEDPRTRTDPVNPDSDGDGLPDAWEVKHGRWDFTIEGWNLDPAKWSSYDDAVSDADRDLDDDGATWYTYHRQGTGFERRAHTFSATNLVEYLNGTDPNAPSTGDSGLLDGWTIFWGSVYPTLPIGQLGDIYPGAPGPLVLDPALPRPSPLSGDERLRTERLARFGTDATPGPTETLVQVHQDVRGPDGTPITVYRFERLVENTFLTAQAHRTNPYLDDTDGDDASDAFETGMRSMGGSGPGGHPDPTVNERGSDADGDGVPLELEARHGTNPTVADTDLGGAQDGEEIEVQRDPLDPRDDTAVADPTADLDCDGLADADEATGWAHPTLGTVRTSPVLADTDRDGLADGFDIVLDPARDEDQACLDALKAAHVLFRTLDRGRVLFHGEATLESSPTRWSTRSDGIADAYRAVWGLAVDETPRGLEHAYAFGRPDWWNEARHGPWLWGQAPTASQDVDGDGAQDSVSSGRGLRFLDTDLDNDGLRDDNGEDPTPGAGPALVPPNGWPDAAGLTAAEARARGAAFGPSPYDRADVSLPDTDGDTIIDAADRVPTRIRSLAIEGASTSSTEAGSLPHLEAARTYQVTGLVEALGGRDGSGPAVPAPGSPVLVGFVDRAHPVGAGFTDAAGRFQVNVSLTAEHQVVVPEGHVLMGVTGGPAGTSVAWTTNVSGIELGPGPDERPNALRVWVYNTTGAARPGDATYLDVPATLRTATGSSVATTAQGTFASISEPLPVLVTARSVLSLDAPDAVATGDDVPVRVGLADAAGRPIAAEPVTVTAFGTPRTLTTDDQGLAETQLEVPAGPPRTVTITVTYDGRPHVAGARNTTELAIKHASTLRPTTVVPMPALAGHNLTVTGTVTGPGGAPVRGPGPGLLVEAHLPPGRAEVPVGPDGSFNVTLPLPAGRVGPAELELRFPGNDTLLPATAVAPLDVVGATVLTLALPDSPLSPGETADLRARLFDTSGEPLGDRPVTFTGLDGPHDVRTARTGADGVATITWTAGPALGTRHVEAAFDGSPTLGASTADGWVTVSEATILHVERPPPLVRGSEVTVRGQLSDAQGEGLAGQPVDILLGETRVTTGVTRAGGSLVVTWVVPSDKPLGPNTLALAFNGSLDHRHEASRSSTPVQLRQGLSLDPLHPQLQRGTSVLAITVTLDDGRAAPAGRLSLALPTLGVRDEIALDGPGARFTLPIPTDAPLGPITARYVLRPAGALDPVHVNTTFELVSPTRLTLVAPDAVARGQTITVHGTVTDDDARPLRSATVTITLLDRHVNATVRDGRFETLFDVPADAPIGPAEFVAHTAPGRPLHPGTASETVQVRRGVDLSLDLDEPVGEPPVVRGRLLLLDDRGDPIAGERLLVRSADGVTYLVTTDDDGRAELQLQAPMTTTSVQGRSSAAAVAGGQRADAPYTVIYAGSDQNAPTSVTATSARAAPGTGGGTPWGTISLVTSLVLLVLVVVAVRYQRRSTVAASLDALEEGRRRLLAGNEYRAAILHVYDTLVSLVATHHVEERREETLREFQTKVQRTLGVAGPELDQLFDIFDDALYGRGGPDRHDRARAVRALHALAERLRGQATGHAGKATRGRNTP